MYLLLLSDCNEPGIFSTGFRKNQQISNFIKVRPVKAELFLADGQMDMTKLMVFFLQFCESAY